jgi:hypothetical protein
MPQARGCATEVRWINLSVTVESDSGMVQFKNNPDENSVAVISNVAPEPDYDLAVNHLDHYYEVLKRDGKDIPPNEKVKLVPKREQRVDTYDCVPPGALP